MKSLIGFQKFQCAALLLALVVSSVPVYANNINSVINSGLSRVKAAKASQKRVDNLADKIENLVFQYQTEKKVVEGLKAYNNRLDRTVQAQRQAMTNLNNSLGQLREIERQITPLMIRMNDAMDEFIRLDLPFQLEERLERQTRIKSYMDNIKISVAERFRLVLEAYNQENRYGKTIAHYLDTVDFNGQALEVDVLRVGRVGLYFQTQDQKLSGIWDNQAKGWKQLPASSNEDLRYAIEVAQQKVSADLLKQLPLLVSAGS
jgi:vacuolar-type H+-ATPase subunit I/STV1